MSFFLDDEPTIEDRLKWTNGNSVRDLGEMIATCKPPAILGVHGDWGAGKTSFLYLLHHYLTGSCSQLPDPPGGKSIWGDAWAAKENVAVVWFEAWRYQHEAAPVVALLHEIRAQLSWQSKAWAGAKKLTEVAVRSAVFNLGKLTDLIGFQASKIQETGEKWEKENLAEELPSHTLRRFLQDELAKLLPGGQNPRLVVLIDDLDRCESASAFRLLEGIKIYLNLPNCVFVLGVNQASIEASLAEQLAKEKAEKPGEEARQRARDYLEKICKNFWPLPCYPPVRDLVTDWLNGVRDGHGPAHAAPIAPEYVGVVAGIIDGVRCLPSNPRKIKAFVNTLALFLARPGWNALPAADPELFWKPRVCVLLAYVLQFYPDMYRRLDDRPQFFSLLAKWCRTPPRDPDERKTHPIHEMFTGVKLVEAHASSPETTSPTPGTAPPSAEALYPDPARGNVFRAQQLVLALDGKVNATQIASCLLR